MVGDDGMQEAIDEALNAASAEEKLAQLVRLRQSVLSERKLLRALTLIAIMVGSVGIWQSVGARSTADDAREALDVFRAQRTESRVIACNAENDSAARINALNDRTQDLLRAATADRDGDRTPEAQARVEALLNGELVKYEAIKIPYRKCDLASVEAYYEEHE